MCSGSAPKVETPPAPEPVKQTDEDVKAVRDDVKKKAASLYGIPGTNNTGGVLGSPERAANIKKTKLGA